jgi:O-antigen/teichoic acid export membrane protein
MQSAWLEDPLVWWVTLALGVSLVCIWRWGLRGAAIAVVVGPAFTVIVFACFWFSAYVSTRDHTSFEYRDVFEGVPILIGVGSFAWSVVAVPLFGVVYIRRMFARRPPGW